jgi:2-polyprenyl-3-methyl-5-hydroxy-6-metoxy-1,4-benzoquinol methylase
MRRSRVPIFGHSRPLRTEAVARSLPDLGRPSGCPSCGSEQFVLRLADCPDRLLGVPGVWSVVRCESCGVTYTWPRTSESELLRYYPSSYHVYTRDAPVRSNPIGALVRRLSMIPYSMRFGDPDWMVQPFGNRRFLDVGCGAGELLKRIGAGGWQCTGIDISSTAVAAARKAVPDATVEVATLSTFRATQPFALISMQHVLEHLPDPLESVRQCRRLLQPGGLLVIGVPNIASVEARIFRSRWIGLDLPRHLTHFTPEILTRLVEQCGFEVVRLRPAMFATSLSESLALALPQAIGRRLLGSTIGKLLYYASVFPASISYLLGNNPVLELMCRRRDL